MEPSNQNSNLSDIMKMLKADEVDDFCSQLKNGWSSLPPWADYILLKQAIKLNRYEIIKVLLESGCRVMKPGVVNTPLHAIVQADKDWWDLIGLFLKLGARVSDANSQGNTVVHLMYENYTIPTEVLKVLLRRHLQETTVNVKNQYGLSFLHVACTLEDVELVKRCLDYNPEDLNCQISMNEPSRPGFTPLHCAIEYNQFEVVKFLLAHYSPNLNLKNSNGSTPVHYALETALQFKSTTILDLLFEDYYFIGQDIIDRNGRSLFMALCATSDSVGKRFTRKILVEGINNTDNAGNTALHFAANFGRYHRVSLLLQCGADCCRANDKGLTPFALSQRQGHQNVCNLLKEHCCCDQPAA